MERHEINFDTTDIDQLKNFFNDHKDYKTHEIACKFDVPVSTVRFWKQKAGIKDYTEAAERLIEMKSKYEPGEYELIDDPKIWDNRDWFYKKYVEEGLGTAIISKMINRSRPTIIKRLKRYRIDIRSMDICRRSKNKYFDKEWLIDKYYNNHMPRYKVAKLAGVSDYTISNWLIHFGILPRDNAHATVVSATSKRVERYRRRNGTSLPKISKRAEG